MGGCNFTSSRTGNVHEQTRLPLHLWLMTPNSDFSVLLQTPIHLFTRSLRLDMLAGTHITAYIHNGAHHLPGPLPLYLPSLAAIPTRPSEAQGGVHPPLSRLHPPEASRHHILFILISEDLTNRPPSLLPQGYRSSPQRAASWLLVFSVLFSLHSQDGSFKVSHFTPTAPYSSSLDTTPMPSLPSRSST